MIRCTYLSKVGLGHKAAKWFKRAILLVPGVLQLPLQSTIRTRSRCSNAKPLSRRPIGRELSGISAALTNSSFFDLTCANQTGGKMKFIVYLFLLPIYLSANSNPGIFGDYLNTVFVETGTLFGASTTAALDSGFKEVYSIELSEKWHMYCLDKFRDVPNVHLWQGDSGTLLAEMIRDIDEPITFWLDAHYSGAPTAMGSSYTPILQELEAIRNHPIKTHTILIDDIRCFGTEDFDFIPLAKVLAILQEINPKYTISYRDGYVKRDILVAKISH